MANKFALSKNIFENIVKHLVDLEDEKNKLMEEYFPEPTMERNEFRKLLDKYITQVDRLLKNTGVSENVDNHFPFVIIGSEVEVQDYETNDVFEFKIVPPFQGSAGNNDVSYLSPIGKSLLLKKVGDKAVVNAPGGEFCYKIISISLPASKTREKKSRSS